MPQAPETERHFLDFREADAPEGWAALLAPLKSFPPPEAEKTRLVDTVEAIIAGTPPSIGYLSFLQFTQLHQGGAADLVTKNAAKWSPLSGLGVWPDRPPPRLWDSKSFYNFPPGYDRPVVAFTLFRLAGDREAREDARKTLAGCGVNYFVGVKGDPDAWLEKISIELERPIEETTFQGLSFYAPLLSAGSVAEASAEQLDQWLLGAPILIRESHEDKSLFILGKTDLLTPILELLKS